VKKNTHHGPVQGQEGEITSLVAARGKNHLVQIPSRSVKGQDDFTNVARVQRLGGQDDFVRVVWDTMGVCHHQKLSSRWWPKTKDNNLVVGLRFALGDDAVMSGGGANRDVHVLMCIQC
jgi:hypothetical protein